jgi:ATP-binding cassette, subfamily B, bacterial
MNSQRSARRRSFVLPLHRLQVEPRSKKASIWGQRGMFVGDRSGAVAALVISAVFAGFCESAVIAIVAEVATALVGRQTSVSFDLGPIGIHARISELLFFGLLMALVRIALQVLISYLPARISADIQAGLRNRLFAAFIRASWSVQSADDEGTFQELATSQIVQATTGVIWATTALTTGIMLFVMMASAVVVSPVPALIMFVVALALFAGMRPFNALGSLHARSLSAAQLNYASGVYDAVALAEETEVFGVGEAQEVRLRRLVTASRDRFLRTQFIGRMVTGTYQTLVMALLLGALAAVYATGATHVASLGAVVLLLVRASTYGQQAQTGYHYMHQSLPFLNRLSDAERRYLASPVVRGTRSISSSPSLVFDDVSYAYVPDVPILREISFRIEPGEAIGVVGPTGSGKSTLVQILLGLREPIAGQYLIEDQPANTWSIEGWTRAFAYVSQEPRLFHGTVAENISFYRDLDRETIERAARLSHIHDEIMSWPNHYDTMIGQRADAVSGGQRQRICLARALAGDPLILVLDEATSALDPRSAALVQESLVRIKHQVTLFVIAHRFSTLDVCDRVMVLRDGQLEAFADANVLLQSNGFFRSAAALSHTDEHVPTAVELG